MKVLSKIRISIALFCMCVVFAGLLTGCGKKEGAKVVLTAGFKKDEVFRIADASCTLPEVMVYLANLQNQYERIYGVHIWDAKEGEDSLAKRVREQVLAQLAQVKAMALLAQKKEVTLTEQEEERVVAAARDYYTSLSQEEVAVLGVTEKLIARMYREYTLARKVYRQIVEGVNPEISDDEARTITVQAARVSSRQQALEIRRQALEEGVDFAAAAKQYNEEGVFSWSFGQGEVDPAIEAAAFELGKDEISDVVEVGDVFYVLKCVSTFDEAQTQANKIKIADRRRNEAFTGEYDTFVNGLARQLNEELWDDVGLLKSGEVTTEDFFEIYELYFQTE